MRRNKSAITKRRGAALILLVVMLLLVIVSATGSLVTTTVANRQAERKHAQVRMMLAAIEHATTLNVELQNPVVFPVNESRDERIEITSNEDRTAVTAIWYVRKIQLCEITRPYDSPSGRSVSENQSTSAADES